MNEAIQTRALPIEWTVSKPNGGHTVSGPNGDGLSASAVFHGADAEARAKTYAAFLNAPAQESHE